MLQEAYSLETHQRLFVEGLYCIRNTRAAQATRSIIFSTHSLQSMIQKDLSLLIPFAGHALQA